MIKTHSSLDLVSRFYLGQQQYVIADDASYNLVQVNSPIPLGIQLHPSIDQYFNIFCGISEYYSYIGTHELVSEFADETNQIRYEDALWSNLHTLKAVEAALKQAIEVSESLLDFMTAEHLRSIYHEEKNHYKLIESDLAELGVYSRSKPCISTPLVNFIRNIDLVDLSDSLLAVGLVLEFNSLQVDKSALGDELEEYGDLNSAFYKVHSFEQTEIDHFSNNIRFITTLSPKRMEYILHRVCQVIPLMYEGMRNYYQKS
ncbi:hypothetical protein KUL42_29950 [Alteromonas sp. KUL42]|uniref:hypothetical protein n=1 Tax=Alteromonas sp. KUL42 TaxID=2480797 RepID=UPI0010358BB1|nr:hypothetical protein [Alteromonas sp. KUL42]TAP33728.1 hypothetical protein EYR97_14055 [Alteromonas sp. KUL42]GEA08234.1 hypothetical protein KUL42_29950 [Alteromonas sp. KUL42]